MTTDAPPSSGIQPVLVYADIEAGQRYLASAFGFEPGELHRAGDGTVVHGEVTAFGTRIWMHRVAPEHGLDSPARLGAATANLVVYVPDVDAHFRQVAAAGGQPTRPGPVDQPYGLRDYSARDSEGHLWTFATPIAAARS